VAIATDNVFRCLANGSVIQLQPRTDALRHNYFIECF